MKSKKIILGILCRKCRVKMRVERTIQITDGILRYRKCPLCNKKIKTFEG